MEKELSIKLRSPCWGFGKMFTKLKEEWIFSTSSGDKLNKEDLKALLIEAIEFYNREQNHYN